jgi:hypothetical protein
MVYHSISIAVESDIRLCGTGSSSERKLQSNRAYKIGQAVVLFPSQAGAVLGPD